MTGASESAVDPRRLLTAMLAAWGASLVTVVAAGVTGTLLVGVTPEGTGLVVAAVAALFVPPVLSAVVAVAVLRWRIGPVQGASLRMTAGIPATVVTLLAAALRADMLPGSFYVYGSTMVLLAALGSLSVGHSRKRAVR